MPCRYAEAAHGIMPKMPKRHDDGMPKRPVARDLNQADGPTASHRECRCSERLDRTRAREYVACRRAAIATGKATGREGREGLGCVVSLSSVRDRQAAEEVVAHEVVQRVAELLEDLQGRAGRGLGGLVGSVVGR